MGNVGLEFAGDPPNLVRNRIRNRIDSGRLPFKFLTETCGVVGRPIGEVF